MGCAVFAYDDLRVDFVEAPHGRAPAVATGIRRVRPDAFVLTYQGDGDLAAIGTAEIVHAAARGERMTTVFVNNGIYGMTGGQMAPTTLLGQRTTSSPEGRDRMRTGFPLRITEMLGLLPGVAFAARGSLADAAAIGRTKALLRRACAAQPAGAGFGGQGLLFAAEVHAHAGLARGHEALWIPAYGPEMRGGTASCTVICADGPIGSPVVDRYQVAALLNAPSAERFLARVAPGGIAVVNADLVGDVTPPAGVRILRVPCTSIGRIGGDERMTAIVALGALVAAIDEIDPDAVETALLRLAAERHPGLREGSSAAFRAGVRAARGQLRAEDAAAPGEHAPALVTA